ncbi:uL15 family ribosomal protein [Patescibacteria group bacterium]|nr:uL15 family ribosomal protein [Patescibacteria group bacterium]
MQLHNLSIKCIKPKRVGRGGKRGKTAGRGTKGQKSRAGHRIRPAQRDFLIRLPKLRGYKNNPTSQPNLILNLDELEKIKGEVVNRASLKAYFGKKFRNEIKILGNGKIKKAIKVEGIKISKIAKDKIEKAGGSVN